MEATAMNTVLFGDVRQTLRALPDCLFHCAMTSPPYWNLRSYLRTDDPLKALEIGSERTPQEFVETMAGVFGEVRRVLRDDGVLYVNLGDSYESSGGKRTYGSSDGVTGRGDANGVRVPGDGNQCLMPHRVAMAMQQDGWILRSTIIWAKKSPMPESISGWRWKQCVVKTANGACARMGERTGSGFDYRETQLAKWSPCPGCDKCLPNGGLVLRRGKWRPTIAHEYVFMFSKSGKYFCDGDAVAEQAVGGTPGNKDMGKFEGYTRQDATHRRQLGKANGALSLAVETRNPRSVWSLSSEPYKGAHFATFPTELARRCIAAATSKAGCCAGCGSPFAPVVISERVPTRPGIDNQIDESGMSNRDPQRHVARTTTTGYRPTCNCGAGSVPCRVLDPFGGSGTVGQVAKHLGSDYVLCELNREYLPLIQQRIDTPPRWKIKSNGKPKHKPQASQRELFA